MAGGTDCAALAGLSPSILPISTASQRIRSTSVGEISIDWLPPSCQARWQSAHTVTAI